MLCSQSYDGNALICQLDLDVYLPFSDLNGFATRYLGTNSCRRDEDFDSMGSKDWKGALVAPKSALGLPSGTTKNQDANICLSNLLVPRSFHAKERSASTLSTYNVKLMAYEASKSGICSALQRNMLRIYTYLALSFANHQSLQIAFYTFACSYVWLCIAVFICSPTTKPISCFFRSRPCHVATQAIQTMGCTIRG